MARQNIALLKGEAERQLASELGDEPHHRSARSPNGSEESWSRLIISSSKPRRR